MRSGTTIRLKNLEQTCTSCPSQWEATLDDGRMLYIRYRFGTFTVKVSPSPTSDSMDAVSGEELVHEVVSSEEYDGELTTSEMLLMLAHFGLIDSSQVHKKGQ